MTTTRKPVKPLLALRAGEVMTRDVILLSEELSLRAAAHLLSQERITGAPVVDAQGRCVGVLSATDFMNRAALENSEGGKRGDVEPCVCAWQVVDLEGVPADYVRRHMTSDPVMVTRETPICEVARNMLDARIHRVVVVDTEGRPVGVISSTDILALVARVEFIAARNPDKAGAVTSPAMTSVGPSL